MKFCDLLDNVRRMLPACSAVLLAIICWNSAKSGEINTPAVKSDCYEAEVPDTLDLAERGRLALGHFLAITREDYGCEMPLMIHFRPEDENGPRMLMHDNSLGACQAKAMEAMAFLRLMTGSTEHTVREAKMLEMMVSRFGTDGLHWVSRSPEFPRSKELAGPFAASISEPFVMVGGQGRMLRAMNAWYQYTGNRSWLDRINGLIDGLDKIVAHKDNYAYFPIHGRYEGEYLRSCYVKEGWKDIEEPANEKAGEEGSLFNHQGCVPGGMATSYFLSGNDKALRLSGELVRFLAKPNLWADWEKGEYPQVVGAEHAHWQGHWHGYVNALRAILDYAVAVNDSRLMLFVREGYEWGRQKNLGRIGYFDYQGCGTGRFIGLAVKLSYYGIGDYWEDVDQYIRNYGTEMQIVPEDMEILRKAAGKNLNAETEKILEKCVGGFAGKPNKTCTWLCCSPHGAMGIFYAWDATLRYQDDVVRVNLLLNRASPWMDMDSYLPYEGKVVLKNKQAKEAFVRIPLWADKNAVRCQTQHHDVKNVWFGQYLHFSNLAPDDVITIKFPMVERTETWTVDTKDKPYIDYTSVEDHVYTCRFKGNTLVSITPPFSALFAHRQEYLKDKAPMHKVTRCVTPLAIKW
jgi:hypothetical protein